LKGLAYSQPRNGQLLLGGSGESASSAARKGDCQRYSTGTCRPQAGHLGFAEFSEASAILNRCIEHDPGGVWEELKEYLPSASDAFMFSIGFPRGVVDQLPIEQVWKWVDENPEENARIIVRFVAENLSNDNTLASRLSGTYGDIAKVGNAFFSEYTSGAWSGSSADHWNELATRLDEVTNRTSLPKLRRWAAEAVRSLREMAARDRQREEEEDLRRN
jgi:hypothetical protein